MGEFVIVGADGTEHEFPDAMDPKRAAEIVRSTDNPAPKPSAMSEFGGGMKSQLGDMVSGIGDAVKAIPDVVRNFASGDPAVMEATKSGFRQGGIDGIGAAMNLVKDPIALAAGGPDAETLKGESFPRRMGRLVTVGGTALLPSAPRAFRGLKNASKVANAARTAEEAAAAAKPAPRLIKDPVRPGASPIDEAVSGALNELRNPTVRKVDAPLTHPEGGAAAFDPTPRSANRGGRLIPATDANGNRIETVISDVLNEVKSPAVRQVDAGLSHPKGGSAAFDPNQPSTVNRGGRLIPASKLTLDDALVGALKGEPVADGTTATVRLRPAVEPVPKSGTASSVETRARQVVQGRDQTPPRTAPPKVAPAPPRSAAPASPAAAPETDGVLASIRQEMGASEVPPSPDVPVAGITVDESPFPVSDMTREMGDELAVGRPERLEAAAAARPDPDVDRFTMEAYDAAASGDHERLMSILRGGDKPGYPDLDPNAGGGGASPVTPASNPSTSLDRWKSSDNVDRLYDGANKAQSSTLMELINDKFEGVEPQLDKITPQDQIDFNIPTSRIAPGRAVDGPPTLAELRASVGAKEAANDPRLIEALAELGLKPDAEMVRGLTGGGPSRRPLTAQNADLDSAYKRLINDERGSIPVGGLLDLVNQIRMASMLSGLALPKSLAGNAGAILTSAVEGKSLRPIMEATRFGTNAKEFGKAWRASANPAGIAGTGGINIPGRLIGAADATTTSILGRAGVPLDEAQRLLLTRPNRAAEALKLNTPAGKALFPFQRTPFNAFAEGMSPENWNTPGRAALTAGAAGVGAVLPEDIQKNIPLLGLAAAAAGPRGLPFLVGAAFGGGGRRSLAGVSPLPEYGIPAGPKDLIRMTGMEPAFSRAYLNKDKRRTQPRRNNAGRKRE